MVVLSARTLHVSRRACAWTCALMLTVGAVFQLFMVSRAPRPTPDFATFKKMALQDAYEKLPHYRNVRKPKPPFRVANFDSLKNQHDSDSADHSQPQERPQNKHIARNGKVRLQIKKLNVV